MQNSLGRWKRPFCLVAGQRHRMFWPAVALLHGVPDAAGTGRQARLRRAAEGREGEGRRCLWGRWWRSRMVKINEVSTSWVKQS